MSVAQEYNEYVTVQSDRWDLIADKFYGDPTRYEEIIAANPDVPITPILASGLVLRIPITTTAQAVAAMELPPWKR